MIKKIITFIINLLTKTFDYLTSLGTTNNALIYNPDVKKLIEPDTLKALERDSTTRREYGESLVIVTSHGGSCELCKKWEKRYYWMMFLQNVNQIQSIHFCLML